MENQQFLQGDTSSNRFGFSIVIQLFLSFCGGCSDSRRDSRPDEGNPTLNLAQLRQNSPMKAGNGAATARVCSKRGSDIANDSSQVLVDVGRWFQVSN